MSRTSASSFKAVLQTNPNREGLRKVMIRIYHHSQKVYVSCPFAVQKGHFNAKTGRVIKHKYSQKYNDYIDKCINEGKEALIFARMNNHVISISELKNVVSGQSIESNLDFFAYTQGYISDYYDPIKNYSAIKNFNKFLVHLQAFQKGKSLLIHDINNNYVRRFQNYLIKIQAPSTINQNIRIFSQVVKHIRHNSKINYTDDPFHDVKIIKKDNRIEKKREHLTPAEFDKILNYEGTYAQNLARDTFLLMYYLGGLRPSEIVTMTNKNYFHDRFFFQEKTDKKMPIMYHRKNEVIFDRYLNPDRMDDYILPFMKGFKRGTEAYNIRLVQVPSVINSAFRTIVKKTKLRIELTCKVARKTALDELNNLEGKETARDFAGHSSTRTTEFYLDNEAERERILRRWLGD